MRSALSLDGKAYFNLHVVSCKRSFSVLDGDNAGRVMTGAMTRDIIGTYYNYSLEIDPVSSDPEEYDDFYESISAPVDSHVLTVPYAQGTMTFDAYVANGDDELAGSYDGRNDWGNLTINFIAMKPKRDTGMSVRVIYEDVAVGAAEAASVASTAAQPFSDLPLLTYGTEPVTVATNELNQWTLDGARPIRTNELASFWSSAPSKSDCTFDADPTLTITLDGTFASSGIYLYFDGGTGDYCRALTMTWYNGETTVASQDFTPDGQKYFCAKPVTGYNKLVIELKKTSLPYRYAKLRQIFFGIVREFEREDLRSVNVTEGVSVISDDVEINTLDFTLDNSDDIDFIFQEKQPVSAYDGAKLIGVFYIKSSSRSSERLYDVSCQDALGILDDEPFAAAVYSSKNAKELITSILGAHFTLDFDPALEDETVTGYIPDCTKREALQQIVFALRATIDTSASRGVRVRRLTAAAPATIPLDRTYTGGSVETAAVVTEIRVTAHNYSTSGSGESVEVGGTTYYHTTSVTSKTNPNATTQTKPNVIEVRDATLVNSDNVAAVAQHVFDYYMRRQTHSVKIVMDKEAPGDYVQTTTPWGTKITGTLTSMNIRLSGIAAADCEIVGT